MDQRTTEQEIKNRSVFTGQQDTAYAGASRVNGSATPELTVPVNGDSPAAGSRQQQALDRAVNHLLALQEADGSWCAELEGSPILQSEYIMLLYYIGERDSERLHRLAASLRAEQLTSGGWANYPGGPADVSTSVKAYFVLKLLGDLPEAEHMELAREEICRIGGIAATNSYTRIYLSIFGQWKWDLCPAVPPEVILIPDWFPLNIYKMSSWSRAIVVPLSIIWAFKPHCEVPQHANIDELKVGESQAKSARKYRWGKGTFWGGFFLVTDFLLKAIGKLGIMPLRQKALARAEEWIVQRLEKSDGVGAIFPPIINTIIAFDCLGYRKDDELQRSQIQELERLEVDRGPDQLKIQPCFSPVWDTTNALTAILDAGLPASDPAVQRAARWLLSKEVKLPGDWRLWYKGGEPGGWFFEYNNEFYPDADDTAEALHCLCRTDFDSPEESAACSAAIQRGLDWQFACQNPDGGWPAFDKNCDDEYLTYVPFADHNAMIDPSCCDITGRSLQALSKLGYTLEDSDVKRAVDFLLASQESDGTWYGRWGVNYIYGTWLAIQGLHAIGMDLSGERFQKVVGWLEKTQNSDGGWGESAASYDQPELRGDGESTASQTAWALMTLLNLDAGDSTALQRGLDYLMRTQKENGDWNEDAWTGTGFPRIFYLKYHMYSLYFPIMALARYNEYLESSQSNNFGKSTANTGE